MALGKKIEQLRDSNVEKSEREKDIVIKARSELVNLQHNFDNSRFFKIKSLY